MITEIVKQWCDENNIVISERQLQQFDLYAALLKEWNEKMNLTAITDDEGIAVKHFIDSISVVRLQDIKGKVIDIGTGAGFPGVPIKIMCPDIELTLLDSLNKRLLFLEEVCRKLEIKAQLVHSRAEDGALLPTYREQYDIAVSRAVANLPALCEYCLPYVKVGGLFISMKGPDGRRELSESENAMKLLGGRIASVNEFTLPDSSARTMITISKIQKTDLKYPRKKQKINKNPL